MSFVCLFVCLFVCVLTEFSGSIDTPTLSMFLMNGFRLDLTFFY